MNKSLNYKNIRSDLKKVQERWRERVWKSVSTTLSGRLARTCIVMPHCQVRRQRLDTRCAWVRAGCFQVELRLWPPLHPLALNLRHFTFWSRFPLHCFYFVWFLFLCRFMNNWEIDGSFFLLCWTADNSPLCSWLLLTR